MGLFGKLVNIRVGFSRGSQSFCFDAPSFVRVNTAPGKNACAWGVE